MCQKIGKWLIVIQKGVVLEFVPAILVILLVKVFYICNRWCICWNVNWHFSYMGGVNFRSCDGAVVSVDYMGALVSTLGSSVFALSNYVGFCEGVDVLTSLKMVANILKVLLVLWY